MGRSLSAANHNGEEPAPRYLPLIRSFLLHHFIRVTGIPSNTAGIQLCSQSSPPLLHSSQAPIHSSMMVGTLSYMSPEAFMCNETDADGNTIKCGRPSDIWSLGCILYQMVYGKTPFADFKTFWVEFKVIGDDKPMLVAAFIFSGQDVLAASGL